MGRTSPSHDATPTTSTRWIAPVVLPVAAVLLASALLAPDPDGAPVASVITAALLWGGILVAIALVVAAVPWLIARFHRNQDPPREGAPSGALASARIWPALAVVSGFVMLTSLSGRIPRLALFEPFEHNWQGKILDLLWVGILFWVLRRWAREEAGMTWRLRPGSARRALLAIAAVFTIFVGLSLLSVVLDENAHQQTGLEQVLFNLTIPNLTEELIWRGAMLAVLDRAFGTPWRLGGAPVGWGLVITSVVFGAGHMILLSPDGAFSVNVAGGVFAAGMGVLLAWIWAYTRSLWPAFLLHCAPEVAVDVAMLATG
ncbi:CPBP family intramembrane glutamic endopeptidase [Ruania halotolerans]|uniref:CPBP family intramembrane glutamic endopeptidase n=1 Tax=Ruania halotolerans TaxID=2897773 RepID=UPI001E2C8D7F|nr:type II CAAX endopeptidase family protein [Ruania halotolerans]UFU07851.1 CPBP family intramembrane metalloprotease [Ruania halotolerans]